MNFDEATQLKARIEGEVPGINARVMRRPGDTDIAQLVVRLNWSTPTDAVLHSANDWERKRHLWVGGAPQKFYLGLQPADADELKASIEKTYPNKFKVEVGREDYGEHFLLAVTIRPKTKKGGLGKDVV